MVQNRAASLTHELSKYVGRKIGSPFFATHFSIAGKSGWCENIKTSSSVAMKDE